MKRSPKSKPPSSKPPYGSYLWFKEVEEKTQEEAWGMATSERKASPNRAPTQPAKELPKAK
jgi:hypothetical protein